MTETTDTTEASEAPEVEATEVVETVTETEPAAEPREPREPVIIDRPIQTVGRRKEAVVRVRLVPGTRRTRTTASLRRPTVWIGRSM